MPCISATVACGALLHAANESNTAKRNNDLFINRCFMEILFCFAEVNCSGCFIVEEKFGIVGGGFSMGCCSGYRLIIFAAQSGFSFSFLSTHKRSRG